MRVRNKTVFHAPLVNLFHPIHKTRHFLADGGFRCFIVRGKQLLPGIVVKGQGQEGGKPALGGGDIGRRLKNLGDGLFGQRIRKPGAVLASGASPGAGWANTPARICPDHSRCRTRNAD